MLDVDSLRYAEEVEQYEVDSVPHFLFLDAKGQSQGEIVGRFPEQAFRDNLQALADRAPQLPYAHMR